jgi:hypothetical protein
MALLPRIHNAGSWFPRTLLSGNSVNRGNGAALTTLLYVGESFLAGSWACTGSISLRLLG